MDTNDVLKRCYAAIFPRSNFLDVLEGNPDLYGPVWIATTVVLILFLSGTINDYLAAHGKKHFEYDFKLLSGAAGLIYGYTGRMGNSQTHSPKCDSDIPQDSSLSPSGEL